MSKIRRSKDFLILASTEPEDRFKPTHKISYQTDCPRKALRVYEAFIANPNYLILELFHANGPLEYAELKEIVRNA